MNRMLVAEESRIRNFFVAPAIMDNFRILSGMCIGELAEPQLNVTQCNTVEFCFNFISTCCRYFVEVFNNNHLRTGISNAAFKACLLGVYLGAFIAEYSLLRAVGKRYRRGEKKCDEKNNAHGVISGRSGCLEYSR